MVITTLKSEIKCTWNLKVRPELDFDKVDVKDFDAISIPGGFEDAGFYGDAYDERFLNLIREFDREKNYRKYLCWSLADW